MPEKRIKELFPQYPASIELVLYAFEDPDNMDSILARNALIYRPSTDIWLQILFIPKELRNGATGVHYGNEILHGIIEKYRGNANQICFCFDPRKGEDNDKIRKFYETDFGFTFTNKVPGYTFAYLEL